jgi:hypothetical protein
MTAFQVSINGKHKCLAGIDGKGLLQTNLVRMLQLPETVQLFSECERGDVAREYVKINVAGVSFAGSELGNSHIWADVELSVGDRIEVSIIESEIVDEPNESQQIEPNPSPNPEQDREYVRLMCKKWGWSIQESEQDSGKSA